jgi:imidazoleglycerol-phosphate dehydratase/histidinol-phosphatase
MKRLLFIDRDGTIIKEPPGTYQVDRIDLLEFLPGAITCLSRIASELDYELVMVTNQDGLGSSSFPLEDFEAPHNMMLKVLESVGVAWKEIIIDPTLPEEKAPTRKPGTGRVMHFLNGEWDLENSFVIGDRLTDMVFAHNMGANGIMLGRSEDDSEDQMTKFSDIWKTIVLKTTAWEEVFGFLKSLPRAVQISRRTSETKIDLRLNLDGSGMNNIHSGLGFLDHMLEQLSKHGNLDLEVSVQGDLHIDEHHTIEDIALALGSAFDQALGSRKGIERYGFYLPMDDSLAFVALDFGGRSWLVWEAAFNREKIGDFPTEMFYHFFKSFCDTAKCNAHIKCKGDNEHHMAEAIFKAFAKAIRVAVSRNKGYLVLPSTKGVI